MDVEQGSKVHATTTFQKQENTCEDILIEVMAEKHYHKRYKANYEADELSLLVVGQLGHGVCEEVAEH